MQHMPQVYYIASYIRQRLPKQVELSDLVNAGVIGLVEAYDKFDEEKNTQFNTFATFRIRGAILDSLRNLDWSSRRLRRKSRDIAETRTRLESRLGREANREEIAVEMKIGLQQLENDMTQINALVIIGQNASINGSSDTYDLVESACSKWDSPFESYVKAEQKAQLVEAQSQLSERERLILALHYREEMTLKEIAQTLGVTVSRASRVQLEALEKLKKSLKKITNRRDGMLGDSCTG